MGVFVCRCKDSLGWATELDDFLAKLTDKPDVVHVESLPSACVPEGTAGILRTIREHGLTRVVLASCVCCPLDFICSSCTDQRSRLKSALFNATGISRAMVETCNLRGEVLRLLQEDPGLALDRFQGLIERSIGRAESPQVPADPGSSLQFHHGGHRRFRSHRGPAPYLWLKPGWRCSFLDQLTDLLRPPWFTQTSIVFSDQR